MGAHLALLAVLSTSSPDTLPTYADSATAELITRAIERRLSQDTTVQDYQAHFRYRLSFRLGRRRWERVPVAAVEEQEGLVQWQRPNDLRVVITGRRSKSRFEDVNLTSEFDRPWFVPRGLGDSVRIFGNVPEGAALHPLAPEGPAHYRYAIVDSLRVRSMGEREIHLVAVEIVPARAASAAIAGRVWLDALTAEVVRLSFRYVGNQLWSTPEHPTHDDSVDARRENAILNHMLTVNADIEYALESSQYWMPFRQVLSGTLQVPLVGDVVVPFEATISFDQYQVNSLRRIAFVVPLPDSGADSASDVRTKRRRSVPYDSLQSRDAAGLWNGGRFEIHRAPAESLQSAAWADSLRLDADLADDQRVREVAADLERIEESLPDSVSGRRRHGFGYERLADLWRYNRVQGLSLGLGYSLRVPAIRFTTLWGTARYGFSDQRLTGRLSVIREAPGARWTLSAFHETRNVDPFETGAFGNSFNALFVAHDDADYLLASGGALSYEQSLGRGVELAVILRGEDQKSLPTRAKSGLNDLVGGTGVFPSNPVVREGAATTVGVHLDGYVGGSGGRWVVSAEASEVAAQGLGRVYGEWRQPLGSGATLPAVSLKAGFSSTPTIPQAGFRLGGPRTVRGFPYGTRRGPAFWAAQLDVPITRSLVRPVLFLDAGQADTVGALFRGPVLVGGGIGLSLMRGLIRADLSHAVAPGGGGVRFDLLFRGSR